MGTFRLKMDFLYRQGKGIPALSETEGMRRNHIHHLACHEEAFSCGELLRACPTTSSKIFSNLFNLCGFLRAFDRCFYFYKYISIYYIKNLDVDHKLL